MALDSALERWHLAGLERAMLLSMANAVERRPDRDFLASGTGEALAPSDSQSNALPGAT